MKNTQYENSIKKKMYKGKICLMEGENLLIAKGYTTQDAKRVICDYLKEQFGVLQ